MKWIIDFFKLLFWIFTPDTLPPISMTARSEVGGLSGTGSSSAKDGASGLTFIFKSEELPFTPEPIQSKGEGLFSYLFRGEELAVASPSAPEETSFLKEIFSAEELPEK